MPVKRIRLMFTYSFNYCGVVKLIIRHNEVGTTSASLRAGIPNIVIPFTTDQPFWRRRVHAIGTRPIHVKKLSMKILSDATFRTDNIVFARMQTLSVRN